MILSFLYVIWHCDCDECHCYDSRLKVLSQETTLVLSNTRELDRVPKTKESTLYTIAHGPC